MKNEDWVAGGNRPLKKGTKKAFSGNNVIANEVLVDGPFLCFSPQFKHLHGIIFDKLNNPKVTGKVVFLTGIEDRVFKD